MVEPASKPARFAFSSDSQRCRLVSDAVPANTKKATNTWVMVLQDYAKAKGLERLQHHLFVSKKEYILTVYINGVYLK